MSEHLSDLRLDALRLEGGSDPHLAACAECRARSAALDRDAAAWGARNDPAALAAEALGASRRTRSAGARWWGPTAAAVLAAGVVLFLKPPGLDQTRTKGAQVLAEVFELDAQGKPRPMRGPVDPRGALALKITPQHGGARVRLLWSSPGSEPEALHPARGEPAWKLDGPGWLDRKIELDGAPEEEALIVVSCPSEIDHAGALDPPADCQSQRIAVRKK